MISIREHLPSRHAVAVILATLAALAVAAATFTRSFSALSDLAVMHQWPTDEAWILPVALDGMIVVPTVAAVVRREARWYAWSLLAAGTILSCAGNGVHAWLTAASQIAVALAIVPPLFTFFAVHLAIVIARQDRDTATNRGENMPENMPAVPPVAPDDHDKTIRDTDRDEAPRPITRLRVAPATPASATPSGATQQLLDLDVDSATAATPVASETQASSAPRRPVRRGSKHGDEVRAEALRRLADGETIRDVADQLSVSKDAVWRWKRDAATPAAVAAG
ncbi:helix-turn-helix domain-containing protein [Rhodococcus zopfii]|uniref:helix-turn-helix domain-containing protein n=1 Tax=Rhodococcus zopfii TaxID=43772 RepID=UPI00352978B9